MNKETLKEQKRKFPETAKTSMYITYIFEIDIIEEPGTDDIQLYQEMIGGELFWC